MAALVHLICDYAPGDLAWSEVISAVHGHLPDGWQTYLTAVRSFETISTGFTFAQLSLAQKPLRPEKYLVFANCAPRKDITDARRNNEGEGLLYAELSNGVSTLAVNSGYSMSFVKGHIKSLWSVKVDAGGSQFRSRDNFPAVLGQLAHGDLSFKQRELRPDEVIPDAPKQCIGYIDSFGNLKTTIRNDDALVNALQPGQRVRVKVNDVVRTATVASGSFNVMEGDLAFAPGSSGHDNRYWEFFQRGGSAFSEFRKPHVGEKIYFVSDDELTES
jgi:hypothetical protein